MSERIRSWAVAVGVGAFAAGAVSIFAPEVGGQTAPEAPSPSVMGGTIRESDASARALVVITGVGHAVRLVRMEIHPECRVSVGGRPAEIQALERGMIVRIEYEVDAPEDPDAPRRNMAHAIEEVLLPEPGGGL